MPEHHVPASVLNNICGRSGKPFPEIRRNANDSLHADFVSPENYEKLVSFAKNSGQI
jgi:hypothetical protein